MIRAFPPTADVNSFPKVFTLPPCFGHRHSGLDPESRAPRVPPPNLGPAGSDGRDLGVKACHMIDVIPDLTRTPVFVAE
jgi:hypothetical protein